jgi:PAS domain S-box-containing protein
MLPGLFVLLAGPALLIPLAFYALAQRQVRGARWYAVLLLAIAFWSLAYFLELTSTGVTGKVIALKVKYVGVLLVPVAWVGFMLAFVGTDAARIRRAVGGVSLISGVFLIVAWTDGWHGLFWGPMSLAQIGPYTILRGRGPGFWINVAYVYCVLGAGVVLLAAHAVHSPYLYKKRAALLVLGAIVPWVGNLIYVVGRNDTSIDPTPFLFSCTAVIAALAVFRYQVLEPVPTLHDARIEAIGDGVIILDLQRRVADVNAAAELMLGRGRAQLTGAVIDNLLPGWPPGVLPASTLDVTFADTAGGRTYDVRCTEVRSRAGETTGAVVILRDVTNRRVTERSLRDSEQRYRDLVENAQDLIYTCDAGGRIVAMNGASLLVAGYPPEELIGRRVLDLVAPESADEALRLHRALDDGAAPTRGEVEIVAKSGARRKLEVSSWTRYRDEGPVTVQVIARDVTLRRRLEEDLRQSQKMEAVGTLAGGVAHDFNNLLTAINGFAETAIAHREDEVRVHECLLQIRRSGDQAAALTRQLLAFGRRQVLHPVDLDLNAVVADVEKILLRLIGERVRVVLTLAHGLRLVHADAAQLQQVILNLTINARDAMLPRGGTLEIRTANMLVGVTDAERTAELVPGAYVVLSVSDTGEGMDASVTAQIFEPFFTTKELGKGTGLGLSTVYGIVKQSGGHIDVKSTPGSGSTFCVFLPAVDAPARIAAQAAAADAVPAAVTATVLLVEDDDAVRQFAEEVLREAGHHVFAAADGTEALTLTTRDASRVDVLVTDVVMPGLNGIELADRLELSMPWLRVLFMSGYPADADVTIGADGRRQFIGKPFKPAELRRSVRALLDSAGNL